MQSIPQQSRAEALTSAAERALVRWYPGASFLDIEYIRRRFSGYPLIQGEGQGRAVEPCDYFPAPGGASA